MTTRERIQATLRHELADHLPVELWYRAEVMAALKEHFALETADEVLEKLGVVALYGTPTPVRWPQFEQQTTGVLKGESHHSGRPMILRDERTFEDEWGIVRRVGTDGKLDEWITGPLVDTDDVAAFDFRGRYEFHEDPDERSRIRQAKEEGKWVTGAVNQPYKMAWLLRGVENLLADYILNRDFLDALYDELFEFETECAVRLAAAGADEVRVVGDIAMQDRVIMGPKLWREVDKPRLAELIRRTREANPDVTMFIHTDGDYTEIVGDLIDIGFDILNPIQPECMNPTEVKRLCGDKATMHGTISIQKTLPFGSVDDVRAEVIDRIENCGYNGGLILAPSNQVMYDVPIENLLAFFETIRNYDYDALRKRSGG